MEIVKEPIAFDPNKKYTWQAGDQFTINGQELGLVLNAIRGVLSTEDAQRILLAAEADKAVQAIMARNVENGIIKEAENN